jgi:hypothetical protein
LPFEQWAFLLAAKQVPELKTEPVRVSFHLAAEFLTATALMTSGAGLLVQAAWALQLYPVAVGMLIYTVIVSPGYFAQKHAWPLVGIVCGSVHSGSYQSRLVLLGEIAQ